MVKPFRRRCRSQRGAELIELALVLPILLLLFGGLVDFALLFQRHLTISNAAREGARIAVLPGYTEPDVKKRVAQYAGNEGDDEADDAELPRATLAIVPIDPDGTGPAPAFSAARVTVTLTRKYLLLGPISGLLGGGSFSSITLSARSTMRIES